MSLVSLKDIINNRKQGTCVGAFNIHNLEFISGVVSAAEETNTPTIMMINEAVLKYGKIEILGRATLEAAKLAKVDMAVMVDHGHDMDFLKKALENGMDVMYDGSTLEFSQNIINTKEIVDYAHNLNHSVEGEIGALGLSEDGDEENEAKITTVKEAVKFENETGIDVLAISVGNVHGFYKGKAQINVERIKEINDKVKPLPVVMHGGSDIPLDVVERSIAAGISKFNIATDLKYAYAKKMAEIMGQKELPLAPLKIFPVVADAVKVVAIEKIKLFSKGAK
jgi:ketose-bisphosphate aldolase